MLPFVVLWILHHIVTRQLCSGSSVLSFHRSLSIRTFQFVLSNSIDIKTSYYELSSDDFDDDGIPYHLNYHFSYYYLSMASIIRFIQSILNFLR